MVAILIHRICHDTRMKRHKELNDCSSEEEASMRSVQEDVRKRRSPRQQPAAAEDSRDPQAAEAAAPSPAAAAEAGPLTTVITAMSDMTYNKTPSFEQRDEQRSAFLPVQSDEVVDRAPQESKQDESQEQEQETSSTPMPHRVHRRTSAEHQYPLPYQSPIRYYQQQEEQDHEEGSEAADAEAATAHQYHHQYQGYPYQNPTYDYSYYNPPPPDQDTSATPMSGSPYHHPVQYSGYYQHQEYSHYPSGYSQHYSYYPSPTASGQQHPAPAYSAQYPHRAHHYYYPGASPPSQTPSRVAREPSSAVTESTKGTTSSAMARKAGGGGDREGLDPSPSRGSRDDDRKPSAEGIGRGRKGDSPRRHDYEPIPLHQIAAIPALSSARPPSPPAYAASASAAPHDAFPDAFPGRTAAPGDPRGASPPVDAADGSAHVSPPVPRQSTPSARRRPQRTIAPSSSGSTASSAGVEGGSWERRYQELMDFKRIHSHCEVPQNYAENTSLGTWVNKQRMEHKNRIEGKNSSLNDSRLERLERIGFRWAKRKGQASWDEKFKELVAYKAKFGNCHVPTKYKDNTALGRWVSTQRAEYKKYQEGQAKTSMNADKIRRLESIGFAWFMAL